MKIAACVALLATFTTACTMSRPARVATVTAGAALTMAGFAVASQTGVDADDNGYNESPFDDNWDAALGGTALVGLGVLLMVAGIAAHDAPEAIAPSMPLAPFAAPPSVGWTPPAMTVPPRAALPEVATDDAVLRMAQQARAAVEHGHCDAAWSTWSAMNARDARYAAAIAAGPVFAPCPRATAVTF
jgi:hypothetical protein